MDAGYMWLESTAARMKQEIENGAAPTPERVTVRELLRKFAYSRRNDRINNRIRNGLDRFGLRADQDITVVWLDSAITITLDTEASGESTTPQTTDPTYRVSMIPAANRAPASVKPDNRLEEATTIMQMNAYSRLPVMKNERDVAGILTWESIGTRLALKRDCTYVRQCMESAEVIAGKTRLFDTIEIVTKHGYVLVRGEDRKITGIVTVTDLADQLGQFVAPFLFVGEIEGHLRNIIHGKFTLEQLNAASLQQEPVEGSSDLTFGAFCRLLGNPENWERLNLAIDRKEFIKRLDAVREMRNDVMHFNPDGIAEDRRRTLRSVARFFDKLARSIAA